MDALLGQSGSCAACLGAALSQSQLNVKTIHLKSLPLTAWHSNFGDHPTTVAKAIGSVTLGDSLLSDALDEIAGQSGGVNSRILGRWVERNRGRPHNGLRIDRGNLRDGRQTWIVCKDGSPTPTSAITH